MRSSVVVPCTRRSPQYVAIGAFATAVARIVSSDAYFAGAYTGETRSPMRSSVVVPRTRASLRAVAIGALCTWLARICSSETKRAGYLREILGF